MTAADFSQESLQTLAYATLSKCFREHEDEVLEIEILPPAFVPTDCILLQDGLNLGLPKKAFALAYMEAQKDFSECKGHDNGSEGGLKALGATKVMLLFDPEHLTAAGYRKRRLNRLKASAQACIGSTYHKALRQELCFLNTILTSPLHRQSKSPTLWYQRLLVLDPLIEIELEHATEEEKSAFWLAEIAAVCKSGERHPKNYYAWQYARRIMPRIVSRHTHDLFAHIVKDWCCQHTSDISGWTFLLHLISDLQPESTSHGLLEAVVSYAVSFQLHQESLWVFIRTALAQEATYNPKLYASLCDFSKNLAYTKPNNELSKRVTSTLHWIKANGPSWVDN